MRHIYPVIIPVPDSEKIKNGKTKVKYLSRLARNAIEVSGRKSGIAIKIKDLTKDKNGVPLPVNGIHWSLTHKTEYVAGVVDSIAIGIDIEKIRPCSMGLFKKTATNKEWNLSDSDPFHLFFRYWTAKEAVLKTVGIGIRDLMRCYVTKIEDATHLQITYLGKIWNVEHFFFHEHIASVVKNKTKIKWALLKNASEIKTVTNSVRNSETPSITV